MKKLKITLAAIALAGASFGSFAADLVNSQPQDQQKVGVISVSGASDITSLEAGLAAKADQAGAKSFRIIGAGGNNQLHGTAVIYK
ncbi:multiple stress resistance protein BhsA [Serratia ficaria]|uniref:multiple stress resistance protein BhsA n=1 Tax=Serratia ficaria TaxID=61651 RepID=UPI0021836FEE|nr:YdgH/BhsA/McbA-like domain containing protein [Serratia ficaria]CAI2400223.1 Multiple stress resistance protein BhsA precursor [Serratia ficaria]